MATPCRPTCTRALFIMVNMARMPPFSGPTIQPMHWPLSPKRMVQVGEAWMPSLCSTPMQVTSLRVPSGRNLGTRNRLMPFVPGGLSGVRASTRWTMFSAASCSPQVMKILVPSIRHVPSPTGSARDFRAPTSLPADGSVRFIVPVHSPVTSFDR